MTKGKNTNKRRGGKRGGDGRGSEEGTKEQGNESEQKDKKIRINERNVSKREIENRLKEKCETFTYDRSSYYQAPGRIETGFSGEAWNSIDMKVGLFCGSGPQMSALLISMSKIGSVVGGLLAGSLPFR